MHTVPELSGNVSAFLAKLWKLVEDPKTNDLIYWSPTGKSFFIKNQAHFARELLPHYYKHNNMASFVRQLNMYGFHKKVSVELGGLKCDKDEMEFAHQYFIKGQPYLLDFIKRKIASSKTQNPAHTPIKPELMRVLTEVRNMRGRQDTLDTRLSTMKHENEALWRELAMLRQKHLKQQQIVNKLIHFLVAFVQPQRAGGISVKRRFPLMIDNSSLSGSKRSKLSKSQASPTGPVIRELDASEPELHSEYIVAEILENKSPIIRSPQEHIEELTDDDNIETVDPYNSVDLKDEMVTTSHEIDVKRKCVCKDKKKRKSTVPVKILIPPLENGAEPREELHLLEIPVERPSATKSLSNKSVRLNSIPIATIRSPKLAAMAASINRSPVVEHDADDEEVLLEDDAEISDNDAEVSPALQRLEDILIVPDIINHDRVQSYNSRTSKTENTVNTKLHETAGGKSVSMTNKDEEHNNETVTLKLKLGQQDTDGASTSSSKDLSLTCVNPSSGIGETHYREHMDNHLETMQNDIDHLRDILKSENCIDANILLGLFGSEDPMTFELPVNPELNPNCEEDDDHTVSTSVRHPAAGGELMAYNPTSTLLDFDDDIFLDNASSSIPTSDLSVNNLCTVDASDPLELEGKALLLESLVTSNTNPKS